jgi:glyoxylase-like metal-dependent hydrolase (beta-lactamase superfamily II)
LKKDTINTYFPFHMGAMECAAVSAGIGHFRVQAFFADVPAEELDPVLERYGIKTEKISVPFNCLLIRHLGTLILIDTGTKAAAPVKNLRQQGIAPEDIGMVVLSHAHTDHIGGAVDDQGKPAFPNARYIVSRIEWEESRSRLAALKPECIEPETELLDNIYAISAPGHTAGQIAVKIESQGETLLYTSDVIAHPIHLEHCNWNIISDADRAGAIQTRKTLLAQAADENWWLFVYHFPFPSLVRIAIEGDGWVITERRTVGGE